MCKKKHPYEYLCRILIKRGPRLFHCEAPPNSPPSRLEEDGSVVNQFQSSKGENDEGVLNSAIFWNGVQLCKDNYWRVVRKYSTLWKHKCESPI